MNTEPLEDFDIRVLAMGAGKPPLLPQWNMPSPMYIYQSSNPIRLYRLATNKPLVLSLKNVQYLLWHMAELAFDEIKKLGENKKRTKSIEVKLPYMEIVGYNKPHLIEVYVKLGPDLFPTFNKMNFTNLPVRFTVNAVVNAKFVVRTKNETDKKKKVEEHATQLLEFFFYSCAMPFIFGQYYEYDQLKNEWVPLVYIKKFWSKGNDHIPRPKTILYSANAQDWAYKFWYQEIAKQNNYLLNEESKANTQKQKPAPYAPAPSRPPYSPMPSPQSSLPYVSLPRSADDDQQLPPQKKGSYDKLVLRGPNIYTPGPSTGGSDTSSVQTTFIRKNAWIPATFFYSYEIKE